MAAEECLLCRGQDGDAELMRTQVWQDSSWRLTTATSGEIAGFSYLEPRRHISDITKLDGPEAATLGPVLSRVTATLKQIARAELVYVYVFGDGIPHLHIHLAPHSAGDALNAEILRGELEVETLPSGAQVTLSKDFPPLPEEVHQQAVRGLRDALAT